MILRSEEQAREWFAARIDLAPGAIQRLERLAGLLREENRRQNLVSAGTLDAIWVRHFADSVQLLDHVPRETLSSPWLDLGSGGGFPGLVIAACRPDLTVVLVECRAKRVAWLDRAKFELDLSVQVAGSRLENLPSVPTSVISARAFAPLPRLLALSTRFSTSQTQRLLPRGRGARQELAAMPKTVQAMFHVEQSLTDSDSVILVGRGVPPLRAKAR